MSFCLILSLRSVENCNTFHPSQPSSARGEDFPAFSSEICIFSSLLSCLPPRSCSPRRKVQRDRVLGPLQRPVTALGDEPRGGHQLGDPRYLMRGRAKCFFSASCHLYAHPHRPLAVRECYFPTLHKTPMTRLRWKGGQQRPDVPAVVWYLLCHRHKLEVVQL